MDDEKYIEAISNAIDEKTRNYYIKRQKSGRPFISLQRKRITIHNENE